MKNLKDVRELVKSGEKCRVVIAGTTEEEVQIVKEVLEMGIADFTFIGDEKEIDALIKKYDLTNHNIPVVNVKEHKEIPKIAIDLIKDGKADIPMKGQIHTSLFVKAILDKESGFSSGKRLSQITMFDGYESGLQFLTDCAINIDYSIDVKITLIENAVKIANLFGIEVPRVALLGAVENVSNKMADTIDSSVISQMNRRNQIRGCIIDGPLSLDNAISKEYAETKGIQSPVAGQADILVATSLNEANSLSKGIIHYAKKDACSIIGGILKPIIMTSRTDTKSNKINTISVACYMFNKKMLKNNL